MVEPAGKVIEARVLEALAKVQFVFGAATEPGTATAATPREVNTDASVK
jgi:hypothetical protein